MALPAVPYPATIEVHKVVDDKASVAFRGNRYSVPPGMGGAEVTLRHRLGTGSLEVFSPSGIELVSHRLAQAGCRRHGAHRGPPGGPRSGGAVPVLDRSVPVTARPTSPPARPPRPSGPVCSKASGTEPSVDLGAMAEIIALAFPGATEAGEVPA